MDLEHNNLSNPYQDVISIHQAHNILSQNISLYSITAAAINQFASGGTGMSNRQ